MKTIGFVGGGRITRIFLGGLKNAGRMPEEIRVSDPNHSELERLRIKFPQIQLCYDNKQTAIQDWVFIGLHPPVFGTVAEEIKAYLKPEAVIISLAPKISIAQIKMMFGGFGRIVRMIPNAPSIVNAGYNPVAYSPEISHDEKMELETFFKTYGECPEVPEEDLEAYAVLTAMGPTYLWFQLYELQSIAVSFGLSPERALEAVAKMAAGTVKTMVSSGLPAEDVMNLIPIKPLGEDEARIKELYRDRLNAKFRQLKR